MSHPSEPDDDLLSALQRLPREIAPPEHVRSNLRSNLRGNLRSNDRVNLWLIAVAASLVAVAFAAGRITAPRAGVAPAEGQKFAFLLYGGPTGSGDDRAAEYGAWAVEARREGRPVSGERLADAAWVAGAAYHRSLAACEGSSSSGPGIPPKPSTSRGVIRMPATARW